MAEIKWTNVNDAGANAAMGNYLDAQKQFQYQIANIGKGLVDFTKTMDQGQKESNRKLIEDNTQLAINEMLQINDNVGYDAYKQSGAGLAENVLARFNGMVDLNKFNEARGKLEAGIYNRAQNIDNSRDYNQASREAQIKYQNARARGDLQGMEEARKELEKAGTSLGTANSIGESSFNAYKDARDHNYNVTKDSIAQQKEYSTALLNAEQAKQAYAQKVLEKANLNTGGDVKAVENDPLLKNDPELVALRQAASDAQNRVNILEASSNAFNEHMGINFRYGTSTGSNNSQQNVAEQVIQRGSEQSSQAQQGTVRQENKQQGQEVNTTQTKTTQQNPKSHRIMDEKGNLNTNGSVVKLIETTQNTEAQKQEHVKQTSLTYEHLNGNPRLTRAWEVLNKSGINGLSPDDKFQIVNARTQTLFKKYVQNSGKKFNKAEQEALMTQFRKQAEEDLALIASTQFTSQDASGNVTLASIGNSTDFDSAVSQVKATMLSTLLPKGDALEQSISLINRPKDLEDKDISKVFKDLDSVGNTKNDILRVLQSIGKKLDAKQGLIRGSWTPLGVPLYDGAFSNNILEPIQELMESNPELDFKEIAKSVLYAISSDGNAVDESDKQIYKHGFNNASNFLAQIKKNPETYSNLVKQSRQLEDNINKVFTNPNILNEIQMEAILDTKSKGQGSNKVTPENILNALDNMGFQFISQSERNPTSSKQAETAIDAWIQGIASKIPQDSYRTEEPVRTSSKHRVSEEERAKAKVLERSRKLNSVKDYIQKNPISEKDLAMLEDLMPFLSEKKQKEIMNLFK